MNLEKTLRPLHFGLAFAFLFLVVLANAWVSDDAYITFRTVFNFTEGYGPVYNVGERVQTYTNPLWMLVMSVAYLITDEAYFTSIVLSLLLMTAGVWTLHRWIFDGKMVALLLVPLMLFSRSFVEYSTSGLENVLNFFLLILFLAAYLNQPQGRKRLITLACIAALGMVSRMDTALLYAPAVFMDWWSQRSLKNLLYVVLGLTPFLAWELFAVVYYGFPFPNTAYAKLNTDLDSGSLFQQGLYYYKYTLLRDPITMGTILAGIIAALTLPKRKWWPLLIGMLFYLVYLLRVGGDFMGGRFFYLPFCLSMVFLGQALLQKPNFKWGWVLLFMIGLFNFRSPPFNWARENLPREDRIDDHGIADERSWFHPASSLTEYNDSIWVKMVEAEIDEKRNDAPNQQLLVWDFIGYTAYGVGPRMRVIDRLALADPLLARLPMAETEDWRVGHYYRVYPRKYLKSLELDTNVVADPDLHQYYDKLRLVTRGPIWSADRWEAIWKFNTGQYEHLIDREFYRNPSRSDAHLNELQVKQPSGSAFLEEGQIMIYDKRPLKIDLGEEMRFAEFEIGLFGPNRYDLTFMKGEDRVANMTIPPPQWIGDELWHWCAITPVEAQESGFDAIIIESKLDNGYYSISHLIPR